VLYKRVCEYLELDTRVEVINTRWVACPGTQGEGAFGGPEVGARLQPRPIF